jgi:hypothetical protein
MTSFKITIVEIMRYLLPLRNYFYPVTLLILSFIEPARKAPHGALPQVINSNIMPTSRVSLLGCSIFGPVGTHGPVPPLVLENSRGKNTETHEIHE